MKYEYLSENEEQTMRLGEELGKSARLGDVFCVNGELGVGKTVFSKGFALGMSIDRKITSPTFTFVNEYEGRLPLFHFDAYRLQKAEEALCFDFEEYFESGVCVIEWADNIKEIIPDNAYHIRIERVKGRDCERKISVNRKANTGK